ncbi:MAG: hypothetical protein ACREFQ_14220, partial [Stellaceae bacterium]
SFRRDRPNLRCRRSRRAMVPKRNPLNLNALQLKTLTLFQALARMPEYARPPAADGAVEIVDLPQPHGDHFHLGDAVVLTRDATGLANPAAWAALERKGLIRSRFPAAAVVTSAGLGYATGLEASILHRAGH